MSFRQKLEKFKNQFDEPRHVVPVAIFLFCIYGGAFIAIFGACLRFWHKS